MFKSFIQRIMRPKSRQRSRSDRVKVVEKQKQNSAVAIKITTTLSNIENYILKEKLNALCIFVSDNSVYRIVGKINTSGRIYNTQKREQEIEKCIDQLIKKLYSEVSYDNDIEAMGKKLYGLLFPDKLPFDTINYVWVDCKLKKINPYWEWLHCEKSFWGDRFIINRINTENFKDFKSEKLDISNGTAIQDTDNECTANEDVTCLEKLLDNVKQIRIDDSKVNDLKADCIHFGLRRRAFEDSIDIALLKSNNVISSKLLFLNICKSRIPGTQDILSDIMTKSGANVCIYTSLDVPESDANKFVHFFYDDFKNGEKNAAEAIKKARIEFKNDNPRKSFWRLSYAIFGNPFIELKFRR